MTDASAITIHTDGGARGNPGPAAVGFVISNSSTQLVKSGRYIGVATNNQAEYHAVLDALSWVVVNQAPQLDNVDMYLDSLLVANQLSGIYQVKTPHLAPLHQAVSQLTAQLPARVAFHHIPREQNHSADQIVNIILDVFTSSPTPIF